MNILWASVTNGTEKVSVNSDGNQNIRCWLDGDAPIILVADYSNMGARDSSGAMRSKSTVR